MSRFADWARGLGSSARVLDRALARAHGWAPALVVLVFAAWLVWPVPLGHMPMSADHTVHLTRIALTADRLRTSFALSGWEPTWFFGFPLGELYPQLGDLLIIAIRALGFGALDWPASYALGFYLVFAIQGLVLVRVGRLFGMGPWPGLIAALLVLADAGFTREGGWLYTVYFGVWPQALATSLAYLGLGELARALGWQPSEALASTDPTDPDGDAPRTPSPGQGQRATLVAGSWFGAALLAHPIALPTLGLGGLVLVVTLVPRAPVAWRIGLARCVLAGLLGLVLAAWWLVPMVQHKGWMASYGWLYAPLEAMLRWLSEDGRWAQRMPQAVGIAALIGVGLASLGAGRVARFVALFAVVQWLLASDDAFWRLRLDRLSEGFTHIQYQRFLIGAKPGLFLLAGLAVIAPAAWARRLWLARDQVRYRVVAIAGAVGLAPACAALGLWLLADTRAAMAEHEVGVVQTERVLGDPGLEADYVAFVGWARAEWDARDHDYRIAAKASRNHHLFMDAPVWTATPQYKLGFTPGDNFVHKPEANRPELLDALGVRWIVAVDPRVRPGEVARFGSIVVRPHRTRSPHAGALAWVADGPGEVEIVAADLRGGRVLAQVRGAEPGARLVFAIAGYPRWRLRVAGEPVEWFEVPVWGEGPAASVAERAAGALRGGKARGDDGSEPTLIAAQLPASSGPDAAVEVELRYVGKTPLEALVELVSALAWALVGVALLARPWAAPIGRAWAWIEGRVAAAAHPLVVAALIVAALGLGAVRWQAAAARAEPRLVGWLEAGAAAATRAELGPVKTDMLIRPAVVLRPRPERPAIVEVELTSVPATLTGWVGLDDDQAQQRGGWGRHELRFEARPVGADDGAGWSTIARVSVPHEPGRMPLSVDTGALAGQPVRLRIVDEARGAGERGRRLPRLGLDLELAAQPEARP